MNYSLVKNNSSIQKQLNLEDIFNMIKSGKVGEQNVKTLIEGIRSNQPKLKRELPGFCYTGEFKDKRREVNLVNYSGLICVDIDKIEKKQLVEITANCQTDKLIRMSFISPSGNGVKILIQTDAKKDDHKAAFVQVNTYVANKYSIEVDMNIKSIAQQCYFSFDPEIYFNPKSEIFKIESSLIDGCNHEARLLNKIDQALDESQLFIEIKRRTELSYTFEKGSRNAYMYYFACTSNRFGIDQSKCSKYLREEFSKGFSNNEIGNCVRSAYKNTSEFGTININTVTSHFPDHIYNQLPVMLDWISPHFENKEIRDMMLLTALCSTSVVFHNVKGRWNKGTVYPNLYVWVLAKAGSGKGNAVLAYKLIEKVDELFKTNLVSGSETNESGSLIIAGNNSFAGMIQDLKDNNGIGIILETEADSLVTKLGQDWGNFAEILNMAYQHERINHKRKDEKIKIKNPKLSIAMTSTPGQIFGMFNSKENGLFSRFCFYKIQKEPKWESQKPTPENEKLSKRLEEVKSRLERLYTELREREIKFRWTDEQWAIQNKVMPKVIAAANEEHVSGVLMRAGLQWYRISMILTCLRGEYDNEIVCKQQDFQIAQEIVMVLVEHSKKVLKMIPDSLKTVTKGDAGERKAVLLFQKMPDVFTTQQALDAKGSLGIEERTIYRILKENKGIMWENVKKGTYKKMFPTAKVAE